MSRRSLRLPISLGVSMIVLLVLAIVVFVMLHQTQGAYKWIWLVLGLLSLGLIVAGVVVYLTLSIKEINLNRRQSNFIDSVTHELKSPIASLKLYLQTLSRRPVSPEEQTEFYRFMLEDVERLDLLINHILSAARLEKSGSTLNTEPIDLTDLLRSCVEEVCVRYRIAPSTVNMETTPCLVLGNRLDLSLIFRNLIDNAVKYADNEAPEVGVHSEYDPASGVAIVRISDNGPGIPHPLQRKIFGRFVRLGTELERKKPGTGLGLYIVRTLVHRWKGRVQVASNHSEGTVFEVRLVNASGIRGANEDEANSKTAVLDAAKNRSSEERNQVSVGNPE